VTPPGERRKQGRFRERVRPDRCDSRPGRGQFWPISIVWLCGWCIRGLSSRCHSL